MVNRESWRRIGLVVGILEKRKLQAGFQPWAGLGQSRIPQCTNWGIGGRTYRRDLNGDGFEFAGFVVVKGGARSRLSVVDADLAGHMGVDYATATMFQGRMKMKQWQAEEKQEKRID